MVMCIFIYGFEIIDHTGIKQMIIGKIGCACNLMTVSIVNEFRSVKTLRWLDHMKQRKREGERLTKVYENVMCSEKVQK